MAVANYFIDLARENSVGIKQFGLMKRVYITHGFCLAVLDRPALNPRFDVVEAWKNGPVIPSVYHSFKYNLNNPIRDKAVVIDYSQKELNITFPELQDDDIKEVANAVWRRYKNYSDHDLIELLHRDGTPWALCYQEGRNKPIPDLYTKVYYKKVIEYERDN